MIRIMHLLPSLEVGGMENGVVNLVNHLDRNRFVPLLCALEREGTLKERVAADVRRFNLRQKAGLQWKLFFSLAALFRRERIDIVHTHNFYTACYGIISARLAGVPVIIHGEHGMIAEQAFRRRAATGLLSRCTDCVLAVSEDLRQVLIRRAGVSPEKVRVIVNGVDFSRFSTEYEQVEWRRRFGLPSDAMIFGAVGRLTPVKNYPALIRTFARLSDGAPRALLIIVGEGAERGELEQLIRRLQLEDRVLLWGERSDVADCLKVMDVLVQNSLSEGMSNVILEAMAVSLPVIATATGNTPELVQTGRTGMLIDPGNDEQLFEALRELSGDFSSRRALGEAAARFVRSRYSLDGMVAAYSAVYEQFVERKRRIR